MEENIRQIDKSIIKKAVEKYKPDFRWLKEAELDYSDLNKITCYGTFDVNLRAFSDKNLMYLGCPQTVICVGQLGYVAWAEILKQELVQSGMSSEEFLNLPDNAMYMIEAKKLRFRRKIPLDRDITGKIVLDDFRAGDTTLIFGNFDFEDKGCFGGVEFAVQRELSKKGM